MYTFTIPKGEIDFINRWLAHFPMTKPVQANVTLPKEKIMNRIINDSFKTEQRHVDIANTGRPDGNGSGLDYGRDWFVGTQPGPMAYRGVLAVHRGQRLAATARARKKSRKYAYVRTTVTFQYQSSDGRQPKLKVSGDHRVTIMLDATDEYRVAVTNTQQLEGE